MKPTDIRIDQVTFGYEDYRYRTPIKFGGTALDRATILNVNVTVSTRAGNLIVTRTELYNLPPVIPFDLGMVEGRRGRVDGTRRRYHNAFRVWKDYSVRWTFAGPCQPALPGSRGFVASWC